MNVKLSTLSTIYKTTNEKGNAPMPSGIEYSFVLNNNIKEIRKNTTHFFIDNLVNQGNDFICF